MYYLMKQTVINRIIEELMMTLLHDAAGTFPAVPVLEKSVRIKVIVVFVVVISCCPDIIWW